MELSNKYIATKWFYSKYAKEQFGIESSLHLERDVTTNDQIFVVSIGSIYVRIKSDEVLGRSPKDSTNMIINYIKIKYPEYFL